MDSHRRRTTRPSRRDLLGSADLRRVRWSRTGRHVGVALIALLAPSASSQSDAPARCQAIAGRLWSTDADDAAAARTELRQLLQELEPTLFGTGEPAAATLDTFALAAGYHALVDSGSSGRTVAWLRDARKAARLGTRPDLVPWLDYLLVSSLQVRGSVDEAIGEATSSLRRPSATEYELLTRLLLAELMRSQDRWDEATAQLRELEPRIDALHRSGGIDDQAAGRARATLLAARAQIQQELGAPDRAASLLSEAEVAARLGGSPDVLATVQLRRIDFDLVTNNFAAAERAADEALRSSTGYAPAQRAQFLMYRGVARSDLELTDPSRTGMAADDLRSAIADPALPDRDRTIARSFLLEHQIRVGDDEDAHGTAEHLRTAMANGTLSARSLVQLGRYELAFGADGHHLQRVGHHLERAFDRALRAVAKLPPRPAGVGFLHLSHHRQVLSTLISLTLRSDPTNAGVERAFGLLLRAERAGTLARRFDAPVVSLAEVREILTGPDHGALVYLPSRRLTHVFAVTRSDLTHFVLDWNQIAIRQAVQPLNLALRRRPTDGLVDRLRGAAEGATRAVLPRELQEHVRSWRRLTVVGSEMLLDAPFACLQIANDRSLGADCAIETLPSLTLGVTIRRRLDRTTTSSPTVHLFGTLAPDHVPDGLRIEAATFDEPRARRLLDAFPVGDTTLSLGPRFTRSALASATLDETAILHLLAHGHYDRSRERGTMLLVAGDRDTATVRCEDIDGLRFGGLAVLSSCGSARGPVRFGDDSPAHLGGAFLWAGARGVVLSHGDVHYETSMELLESFYRHLLAGDSPSEALRRARVELTGERDFLEVYHRVPLQVLGLGHWPLIRR